MGTEVYWVEGSWPGKLGLSARPRGGDWLQNEVANWQTSGVSTIVSLLTPEEEEELALIDEASEVKRQGLGFMSFPIADREVPTSQNEFAQMLDKLDAALSFGEQIVIHCRQGIGRAGLVAACLLITEGRDFEAAVDLVSTTRRASIPDTEAQLQWIRSFAKTLAAPLLS